MNNNDKSWNKNDLNKNEKMDSNYNKNASQDQRTVEPKQGKPEASKEKDKNCSGSHCKSESNRK